MNWLTDLLKNHWEFIADIVKQYLKKDIVVEPVAPVEPIKPPEVLKPITILPREELYMVAKNHLGVDVTPSDTIDDEVDCADSLNTIYKFWSGQPIAIPGYSTTQLCDKMLTDTARFKRVYAFAPGLIIICSTGTGNGRLEHGHCGICGKTWIMSNTSKSGKWEANYTYEAWTEHFGGFGGFTIYLFEPLKVN